MGNYGAMLPLGREAPADGGSGGSGRDDRGAPDDAEPDEGSNWDSDEDIF
jgi:hypothetical protein